MAVKDYKEMWKSEKENVFVFYSQFDMGRRYKVYRRVSYRGICRLEYLNAFETIGEAVRFAEKVFDEVVEK